MDLAVQKDYWVKEKKSIIVKFNVLHSNQTQEVSSDIKNKSTSFNQQIIYLDSQEITYYKMPL